jgi:SOS-response transcriptional repressor LexA
MTFDYELLKQWPERVKMRLKELSMTQDMLAEQMQVTRGAIAHYLGGRRAPPLKQFQKMARILKVEPAWLQYGIDPNNEREKAEALLKELESSPQLHPIPILTWEQIANPFNIGELDLLTAEYLPHIFTDKIGHYGLRIQGDAMTAPSGYMVSFREGDIIQVDQVATPKHNDYIVAVLPEAKEAILRQFVIEGGVSYLKPLNPQYPLIEVNETIRFCGVVVYRIAK